MSNPNWGHILNFQGRITIIVVNLMLAWHIQFKSKSSFWFHFHRSSLEETYSKQLGKLAKQCGSSTSIAAANSATANTNGAPNVGPLCTFTPLWQLLKTSCEKVAQLQLQMAQKLNDMVKDVGKYSDELARKHKVVKESESNTVEAIQV